jgi:hypothetical protein
MLVFDCLGAMEVSKAANSRGKPARVAKKPPQKV